MAKLRAMTMIPYHEETEASFGTAAASTWTYEYQPAEAPDHIHFSGKCPKCNHDAEYVWPLQIVRQNSLESEDDETENGADTVLIRCQCGESHPESNGEQGCGRYWTLVVPRP